MQRPELGTAHWECQSSRLVWRRCCRLPLCLIPCRLLVGSGANCSCLFWFLPDLWGLLRRWSSPHWDLSYGFPRAQHLGLTLVLASFELFLFTLCCCGQNLVPCTWYMVTELYQFMNCYCSSVCSPVARSVGSLSRASSAVVANLHLFLIKAYLLGKKEGYSKLKRFVPGCSLISFICWFRLSSLLFLVHAHHHCEPLCLLCSRAYSQLWQNSLI